MNRSRGSRDLNFFLHYNKKAEKTQKRWVIFAALAGFLAFIAFCFGTVYYIFELQMSALRYEIDATKMIISSPATVSGLARYTELNEQLADLNLYNTSVEQLAEAVEMGGFINTHMLTSIAKNIPTDTSINSMTVSNNTISITGVSKSDVSIAQFEHNLLALDYVDTVFISSITDPSAAADKTLTMSVTMKEAASDETNK